MTNKGSLVCVGVGMTLGSHITPLSRSYIEKSDVVFSLMSDGIVELWVQEMHRDVRSLQPFYNEGTSRLISYQGMIDAMLGEVRAGRKVCGAFYGHPGVFAWVPHRAIEVARSEGFTAHMEAGVSAEDCLYADLGIDPGQFGCAHYEASQFMFYQRRIDPSAYLILWQVGVAGDKTLARFSTGAQYRQILVDLLLEDYPDNHQVIIYQAATLPIQKPRMERIALAALPGAALDMQVTLVVPPSLPKQRDQAVHARLAALAEAETQSA